MLQWHTPPAQNVAAYVEKGYDFPVSTDGAPCWNVVNDDGKAVLRKLTGKLTSIPDTYSNLLLRYREANGNVNPDENMTHAELFVRVATLQELRDAAPSKFKFRRYRKVLKRKEYDDCLGYRFDIWSDNNAPITFRDPRNRSGFERLGTQYACCGQPLVHPGCWKGPQLNVYVAYNAVFRFRERLWYRLLVEQQPNDAMRVFWNADPPPHTHFIINDNEALKKEIEDLKPSLFNVVMPVLRTYVLQLQSNPNQYVDFELPYIPEVQLFIELHNLYNIKLCNKPDTFETFFMIDDFYASAPNRVMDKFIINPDTWVTAINNISRVKPTPDSRYQQLMVAARDFNMQKVNDYLSIKIPPDFFPKLQKDRLIPDSDVEKMRLDPKTFGESYRRGPSPQGIADMQKDLKILQARVRSLPLEQKQKFARALQYNLPNPATATNLVLAQRHGKATALIDIINTINEEQKYLEQFYIITESYGDNKKLTEALERKKQIEKEVQVAEEEANKGWDKRRVEIDPQWVKLIEMASNDVDIQKLQVEAKALKDNNAIIAKAQQIKAIVEKLDAPYKFDASKVPFSYKKFIVAEDFAAQKYTTVNVSNELNAFRNAWKKGQDTSAFYNALEQKVLGNLDYNKILAGNKILKALAILPDPDVLLRYTIGFLESNPIDLTDYQKRVVAKVKELNASEPLKVFETLDQLGLSNYYTREEEIKAAKDDKSRIQLAKKRKVLTQQQADELLAIDDTAPQSLLEAKKVVLEELRTTGTITSFPDFAKLQKEADAKIAKYVDEFKKRDWKAIEKKYGVAVPQSLKKANVNALQREVEQYFQDVSKTNYVPKGYQILSQAAPAKSKFVYAYLTQQDTTALLEEWITESADIRIDKRDQEYINQDADYAQYALQYHDSVIHKELGIGYVEPDRFRAYYNAKIDGKSADQIIQEWEKLIKIQELRDKFRDDYFVPLGVWNNNNNKLYTGYVLDINDAKDTTVFVGNPGDRFDRLKDIVLHYGRAKITTGPPKGDGPQIVRYVKDGKAPQKVALSKNLVLPKVQEVPKSLFNNAGIKWAADSCWIDSVFHALFKMPQTELEMAMRSAKEVTLYGPYFELSDGSKHVLNCNADEYQQRIIQDVVTAQTGDAKTVCVSRAEWFKCMSRPTPAGRIGQFNELDSTLESLKNFYNLDQLMLEEAQINDDNSAYSVEVIGPTSKCTTYVVNRSNADPSTGELDKLPVFVTEKSNGFTLRSVILGSGAHFIALIKDFDGQWFILDSDGKLNFRRVSDAEAQTLFTTGDNTYSPAAYVYIRDPKPINEAALYEQGVLSNKVRREAYKNLDEDRLVNGWIAAFDETLKASPAFEKLLAYPWFQEYKENAYVYDAVKADPNIASAVTAIKVIDESGDWDLVGEWIAESYLSNKKSK